MREANCHHPNLERSSAAKERLRQLDIKIEKLSKTS